MTPLFLGDILSLLPNRDSVLPTSLFNALFTQMTILFLDKLIILLPGVFDNKNQLETCNSSGILAFNFVDFQ